MPSSIRNAGASLERMLALEQPELREGRHHAHPDQSRRTRRAPLIGRTVDDRERLLDPADEALAVRRQAHAARMAFEQSQAEPVFDSGHPPADRAVRHAGDIGRGENEPSRATVHTVSRLASGGREPGAGAAAGDAAGARFARVEAPAGRRLEL